jgi:8-oxo-dGTP pyrophosphatase MutT (NUDIX family)
MHRKPLLEMLERYRVENPAETHCIDRIVRLVSENLDCFDRTCMPGHITASAWILSADHSHALLTHHRKLGRWLQLGGHADGDSDALQVALREAREESGMARFWVVGPREGALIPLDVDVHLIPARKNEPEHQHHDIRFLLVSEPGQDLLMSDESNDLRWFGGTDLEAVLDEESLSRLHRKAPQFLARHG